MSKKYNLFIWIQKWRIFCRGKHILETGRVKPREVQVAHPLQILMKGSGTIQTAGKRVKHHPQAFVLLGTCFVSLCADKKIAGCGLPFAAFKNFQKVCHSVEKQILGFRIFQTCTGKLSKIGASAFKTLVLDYVFQ